MANNSSMRGGRTRRFKAEINVVPYIDVMLVLLVIFMVVAPMIPPTEIKLPKAGQSTQPPTDYIEIELRANGAASVGIHGQKFTKVSNRVQLSEALADLSRKHPELPLMIAADKDIKYDEVVQAITLARQSGIARVGLATR
ncbi:MAG: ExbD/TolR family protein [Oxalobacteraceae bacterium]|jgi:biopolymer transport protein TolR|nr:ExbD/TolR family protein [Oxalobacteraceae bacterium]